MYSESCSFRISFGSFNSMFGNNTEIPNLRCFLFPWFPGFSEVARIEKGPEVHWLEMTIKYQWAIPFATPRIILYSKRDVYLATQLLTWLSWRNRGFSMFLVSKHWAFGQDIRTLQGTYAKLLNLRIILFNVSNKTPRCATWRVRLATCHWCRSTLDYRRFGPEVLTWGVESASIDHTYFSGRNTITSNQSRWNLHLRGKLRVRAPALTLEGQRWFPPIIALKSPEYPPRCQPGRADVFHIMWSPVGSKGEKQEGRLQEIMSIVKWCQCYGMKFTSNVYIGSSYNIALHLTMVCSKRTQTLALKCSRNSILHPVNSLLRWNTGTPRKWLFSEL